MDCKQATKLISGYVDGELDENQKIGLEKHLNKCSVCKKEVDNMLIILDILHNMRVVDLPENFEKELHEKLLRETANKYTVKELFSIKNKYVKALSALTAGILFLFLLKGTLLDGYLFKTKSFDLHTEEGSSGTSAMMAREAPLENYTGDDRKVTNDKGETSNFTAKSKNKAEDVEDEIYVAGMTPKLSLSSIEETRDNKAEDLNILFRKNSRIYVSVGSKDRSIDKARIQALAVENVTLFDVLSINKNLVADDKEESLAFLVSGEQYHVFLNALEDTLKIDSIDMYYLAPSVREDIKVEFDILQKNLDIIDSKIKTVEKDEENSDLPGLENLKLDKEQILEDIDNFLEEYEYIAKQVIEISRKSE